jgi:hypothetical protein
MEGHYTKLHSSIRCQSVKRQVYLDCFCKFELSSQLWYHVIRMQFSSGLWKLAVLTFNETEMRHKLQLKILIARVPKVFTEWLYLKVKSLMWSHCTCYICNYFFYQCSALLQCHLLMLFNHPYNNFSSTCIWQQLLHVTDRLLWIYQNTWN